MRDKYNKHLFDFVYYDTITTNTIRKELLFPPTKGDSNFPDIVKKLNITVEATTPAINDLSLLKEDDAYKYIKYPNYSMSSYLSRTIVDIFNLIPVVIEVREYNGVYHVQTKNKDTIISKSLYNEILNDNLSIVELLSGENELFYLNDKYYREGTYHRVSVRAGILYDKCLTIDDLIDIKVDLDNYEHIHLKLPEPLYTIPTFINDSFKLESLNEYTHSWVPMGFITDIVKIKINDVKSHIIRKFINDIQTSVLYFFDNKYEVTNNMELIINYLERVWTDEIRYVLNKEFPDVMTADFTISRKYKRFTLLRKRGCINKLFKIPNSISYYKDKEFILNKIVEQSCSN